MSSRAARFVFGLVLPGLLTAPSSAAELSPTEGYQLIADLISSQKATSKAAAERLIEARDSSLVSGMVDALFFTPRPLRGATVKVLEALTGEAIGSDYKGWIHYVGAHDEIEPKAGYIEWKALLFSRIDERYAEIFSPGVSRTIRPEEIVWGGVPLDGIPSLDDPPLTDRKGARYLSDDELVFGVVINGVARAYPRRFLSWHEMLNDQVGGEPITLSYCTLCGSAIIYSRRGEEGEVRRFGTSGLLYRSNKLMFDHATKTLWSNLTGKPVLGALGGQAGELRQIPVTLTTWEDWKQRHPETSTLDLAGVKKQFRGRYDFDYLPGAADRARRGVSFPVWLQSDRLGANAEVFTLRLGGQAKAYPVERVLAEGVVNDVVGGMEVLLLGDVASGAIRAYERRGHSFTGSAEAPVDSSGGRWKVTETALVPAADGGTALDRLPGHIAFWFGWYAFYPETEIYGEG